MLGISMKFILLLTTIACDSIMIMQPIFNSVFPNKSFAIYLYFMSIQTTKPPFPYRLTDGHLVCRRRNCENLFGATQCSSPIKLFGYNECLHMVYGLQVPIPAYVFVMKVLSI